MYLHEEKEVFKDIIEQVSNETGKVPTIIEKDYYVTLILKLLSQQLNNCVFKGGTSLSKGFHVIDRFSEDIDITFDEHIGESRRKKLKNVILKGISEELSMPITNWDSIQSDRDYNAYHFLYKSVFDIEEDYLLHFVKLETALGSYSFPTQIVEINNYIGNYLSKTGNNDLAEQFQLLPFSMKLQSLERTYIDKIFALCDYYLQKKSKRYSRHLYDIYKLTPNIDFDDKFKCLIKEVKLHRATLPVCPSAQENVNVTAVLLELCNSNFYKEDYNTITSYFTTDYVSYDQAINTVKSIAESGFFNEL